LSNNPESRVRVCYVISHFHPFSSGAERQALAQGRELSRRGHSVQVVTRSVPGLPREETVDGVRIRRWVRTSSAGPLFGLSFVTGVIQSLRRLRPTYDLIHTHQGLWEAIATGLGRDLFSGAPVLVQPASSGYYGEAEELSRTKGFPVLRRLALRNRHFAAISADIARQWRDLGVPAERIIRTASGVDAEHFRPGPSAEDERLPPRPRAVFTGRLHPQKNLAFLLDVWAEVVRDRPATLVLVGDGPDRPALEEQAGRLGIRERVVFTGPVADPAESLRAADLFVLPSVAEGMSNSLLEAMATGLACLASDIGGNIDLLAEGPCGRLLPPGDRAAWAAALRELLNDPEQARALGRRARERIEREFALPVVVDRYLEIYRGLLGRDDR
jgi:glycosyltransferase involved in cell wall biosynthesis